MSTAPHCTPTRNWVGRPRRGTVEQRHHALMAAATRVFLKHGYGLASIDKVANEAGVSTRTIYQRFKNKADLLVAVVTLLVDRDINALTSPAELERLDVNDALLKIGRQITEHACDSDRASLFRILATEAIRFPALAERMRAITKLRIDSVVERYLCMQVARGALQLRDSARAASFFTQLICAELHERFLFGWPADPQDIDCSGHVERAVELFLHGALPRVACE